MNVRLRQRILICTLVLCAALVVVAADELCAADQAQPADSAAVDPHAVAEGRTAEVQHHGESLWLTVARLLNFGLLVGGLAYFLGPLISRYLSSRSDQIRADLVQAAAMRRTADSQLAEIDVRLKALPAELEELRRRGTQEIAAEEARIRAAADAERQRLLAHMHRDLELQVRIARRTLTHEAAMLAVGVAERRIRASITPADHRRLLDRYTRQLGAA
jgi:F0F1-type ATP synthase membrane subunit b/b'